jgi:uncharacterized Fe-S cluster protein YjdI
MRDQSLERGEAPGAAEARHRPGVEREYRNDSIVVYWEPKLCIHTANCIRRLDRVFNPRLRPWVKLEAADANAISEAVIGCPTGALSFERLDGGPQEPIPEPTVEPQPNGPLYVRGAIEIRDQEGNLLREATRVALCRCGHSDNKPFCDNSHRLIGFRTD